MGQKMLKQYMTSKQFKIGWSEFKKFLMKSGLAWIQKAKGNQMGISPYNRGGNGVVAGDAFNHGVEVDAVGFTFEDWDGVAVQKNPIDEFEMHFNKDQSDRSNGLIPELGMALGMTVAGSHTTVFVRMVDAQVPSPDPKFAQDDGSIDKAKFCMGEGKHAFNKALEEGLEYTFLHWQIEQAFPGVLDWVQTGKNVEAKGGMTEPEILVKMWAEALADDSLNWPKYEESVNKTLAPCTKYTPALSQFLQTHSGNLLEEIPCLLRAFDKKGKVPALGGEIYFELANLKTIMGEKVIFLAYAALWSSIASPKIVDGFAKSISPVKIKALKGKNLQEKALRANTILADARKLAQTLGIQSDPCYFEQLGFLSTRVITILLNLGKTFESREFTSLDEASQESLQRHSHW